MSKNYSSISPSAKSLLMMKARTNIPYAREAACLLDKLNDNMDSPLENTGDEPGMWFRTVHMEQRYLSIDKLMAEVPLYNILELSSGFSFRGMYFASHKPVHYIDTDLPEIMNIKIQLAAGLMPEGEIIQGELQYLPLNALDEQAFDSVTSLFDTKPLIVVNEGLLMYLDENEKKQLCTHIHKALSKNGGYWITADVYIKQHGALSQNTSQEEREFLDKHNIENNKFDNFEQAAAFFSSQGFECVKEAVVEYKELSSIAHVKTLLTPELLAKIPGNVKMQATWLLKPIKVNYGKGT